MIPAGVQVFVALEPVDMRLGFERLSGMVRERMGYEPRSGALFVFLGRRRQLVKILFADATGICVFAKRLDSGVFSLPAAPGADASHVEIDESTLDALLDGLALAPSPEVSTPIFRSGRVEPPPSTFNTQRDAAAVGCGMGQGIEIELTDTEREELRTIVRRRSESAGLVRRARVVLLRTRGCWDAR